MEVELKLIVSILMSLFAAMVMSFAATPVVKSFAERIGAMDVPKDGRRMHKKPVPRLGGLAIFLGFLLSVVLFADVDRQVQGILLGSVLIVLIGVIDDITPLNAWIKLAVQILAALIAVWHGVVVQTTSNPNLFSGEMYINLGALSVPLTVVWIVAITNSVNLIDGLDGLAVGVSTISTFTMFVIALLVSNGNVAVILAALAGACVGFMPYNLNPAKIFMGDTGALLLGYVLATVSVLGLFKLYAIVSFAVPFLILGLPLFDTLFAIMRRLLSGKSPMSPDRGHFHHRLIDMGLNQKQAVAILYSVSAILGLSAVVLTTSGELKAMVLLLAFFVAGVIGVFVYSTSHRQTETAKPQARAAVTAPEADAKAAAAPAEEAPAEPSGDEAEEEGGNEED